MHIKVHIRKWITKEGDIYTYIYTLARPKEKKNKYLGNRRGIQSEDNKSSR